MYVYKKIIAYYIFSHWTVYPGVFFLVSTSRTVSICFSFFLREREREEGKEGAKGEVEREF